MAQWQAQLASQVATQAQQAASGQDSFDVLDEPMVIEGGATLYDAYASTDAFELTGNILFDTTGKFEVSGTLTIGTAVSLQGAIYANLSDVTDGQIQILAYLQFPSQAPIATVYGSLGFDFGTGTPSSSEPVGSFTITVSGEVDLTLPHLPGQLQVVGNASFTLNTTEDSFDFSLNGAVNLDPVGNLIGLSGDLHFQEVGGTPELYGIFVLQTGQLTELQKLGLDLSGTAVLEFNTTSQPITDSLTFPASSPSTQPTTESFTIPADSVSLDVTGSASFEINNQPLFSISNLNLQAFFSFTTDSGGHVDPLLDIYLSGTIDIGSASDPYLQFSTVDFLQASDARIAAKFNVTLLGSSALAAAGINLQNDSFTLVLNTTDQEVQFTPGSITNPSQPGTGTPVDVPAAPTSSTTPQSYVEVQGQGGLTIENSLTLNGSFDFVIDSNELMFQAQATASLGPLGQAAVGGELVIQGGEFAGRLWHPPVEPDVLAQHPRRQPVPAIPVRGRYDQRPAIGDRLHGQPVHRPGHDRPIDHDPAGRGDRGRRDADDRQRVRARRPVRP